MGSNPTVLISTATAVDTFGYIWIQLISQSFSPRKRRRMEVELPPHARNHPVPLLRVLVEILFRILPLECRDWITPHILHEIVAADKIVRAFRSYYNSTVACNHMIDFGLFCEKRFIPKYTHRGQGMYRCEYHICKWTPNPQNARSHWCELCKQEHCDFCGYCCVCDGYEYGLN